MITKENRPPFEVFSELLEFKSEDGKYYFKGYLSTPDIDLVNDLVTPECMKDMMTQISAGLSGYMRGLKGSQDHDVYWTGDTHRVPVSKITSATLDNKGVLIEGMFNTDHPEFKMIWNQVQNGFYDGLSIEYRPEQFTFKDVNGKKIRVLNKIQLKGYGHTPRPANPYAKLVDFFVKSLELADAEDIIEVKGLKETVKKHIHEDIKEYKNMIKDDEDLLAKLDSYEEKSQEAIKTEDIKMTEETTEVKAETQPTPQEEIKQETVEDKAEEKKKDEKDSKDEKSDEDDKEKEEEKCNKLKKEEMKSLIEELIPKITTIIKTELKSYIPVNKAISETPSEKFEVKTDTSGTVDRVIRLLGG